MTDDTTEESRGPGHPPIFETPEDMRLVGNGEVVYYGRTLFNLDFDSERALEAYIVNNISKFAENLGYTYKNHSVDQEIVKRICRSARGRRVDLVVECEEVTCIIELKNPNSGTESRAAIGQVLDYGREFTDAQKKELFIVSTRFDECAAKTIKHYGLPIRYIYFSREQMLEYMGDV